MPVLAAAQDFEAFRDIMPSGDGGIWIRAGEELSYVPAGQYILQTDGSALVSTSVLDFLNEVETASADGFWGPTTKTIMLSGGSAVALGGAALFAPALWTPQSASAVEVDASVSGTVGLDASTISLDAASPVPVTGTVGLNASPLTGTVGLSASPLTGTVGLNASPLTGTVGLNASPLTGSVSLNASALTGSVTGTVALSSSTIATSGPPVFDDLRSVLTTKTFTGEVFAAIANDPDGGAVSYELLPILGHSDYTVDGSGLITKTGTTTDPVQYIAVKATDDEADTAQAIYEINFLEEEAPSSSIAFSSASTFSVQENTVVGELLHDIDASLDDGAADANVYYQIIAGNDDGHFSINAAGELKLVSSLDYETNTSHSIAVEASNYDGSIRGYQNLSISVGNISDFAIDVTPFTLGSYGPAAVAKKSLNEAWLVSRDLSGDYGLYSYNVETKVLTEEVSLGQFNGDVALSIQYEAPHVVIKYLGSNNLFQSYNENTNSLISFNEPYSYISVYNDHSFNEVFNGSFYTTDTNANRIIEVDLDTGVSSIFLQEGVNTNRDIAALHDRLLYLTYDSYGSPWELNSWHPISGHRSEGINATDEQIASIIVNSNLSYFEFGGVLYKYESGNISDLGSIPFINSATQMIIESNLEELYLSAGDGIVVFNLLNDQYTQYYDIESGGSTVDLAEKDGNFYRYAYNNAAIEFVDINSSYEDDLIISGSTAWSIVPFDDLILVGRDSGNGGSGDLWEIV